MGSAKAKTFLPGFVELFKHLTAECFARGMFFEENFFDITIRWLADLTRYLLSSR